MIVTMQAININE